MLYLRCIAFIDIVLCVLWLNCLSVNTGDSGRVLVVVSCFRGCAFPLVMLYGLIFSLVLAFWLSVGVVVRVKGVKSITGDF